MMNGASFLINGQNIGTSAIELQAMLDSKN